MIRARTILILLLGLSCGSLAAQTRSVPASYIHMSGYDFTSPSSEVKLPRKLREISGLSFSETGNLYAVEDERGIVYRINRDTGKIISETRFNSDGDYEGIEIVGDSIFVLRSTGHLFSFPLVNPGARRSFKNRLETPADCDAEALGSSMDKEKLFIGCKSGDGVKDIRSRSIFSYDIATRKIESELSLSITEELIQSRAARRKWSISDFRPSALAIHPESGMIFILSAVNELLLIVSEKQAWLVHFELSSMPQPEGMAFGPDATLYIASEGGRGKGVLFSFNYHKNSGVNRK